MTPRLPPMPKHWAQELPRRDRGWSTGDVRLTGSVARAAQNAGGDTFRVTPAHPVAREVGKTDLTRYVATETMHERKSMNAKR